MRNDADIIRTPNPNCDACKSGRWHTEEDWKNHPKRGTGKDREDLKVKGTK